jgi:hypothetical protein
MFVVHTVHQLEDALKENAKEIMVIGELSGPVQAACQRKAGKDEYVEKSSSFSKEILMDIDEILEINGKLAWERDVMLALMGNYAVMDTLRNYQLQSVFLQRIEQV